MWILWLLFLSVLAGAMSADAQQTLIPKSNQTAVRITDDTGAPVYPGDATNKAIQTAPVVLSAGEDLTATGANASGVTVVESRYLSSGTKAADAQIKASAGYVQKLVCIGTDAAATVGTIKLFDNTAESGTEVFSWTTVAVALNTQPLVFPIEVAFATGIYLGYTTIADIQCTVFYR